jgi:hypothetical protein
MKKTCEAELQIEKKSISRYIYLSYILIFLPIANDPKYNRRKKKNPKREL